MIVTQQYSSMYPNTNIAFNISPNTMYGKVIIDKEDSDPLEVDVGKDFMENLPIGNYATLGSTFFNLPKFEDLYKEFKSIVKIKKKRILDIKKEDVSTYNLVAVNIRLKGDKK